MDAELDYGQSQTGGPTEGFMEENKTNFFPASCTLLAHPEIHIAASYGLII
jgi:hypothetical protein